MSCIRLSGRLSIASLSSRGYVVLSCKDFFILQIPSKMVRVFVATFWLFSFVCVRGSVVDPVVRTSSGLVRGRVVLTSTHKEVDEFLGIAFAEPPTGQLRFKRPLPVKPWEGIFNATTHPSTCFQKRIPLGNYLPQLRPWTPLTKFSEDCLKLNIWVPRIEEKTTDPIPVMILIHGGGFSRGSISSPLYHGATLASEQQVIVAMMNYRLASLGFFFLDHPEASGNVGLYDQLLAIKWLKANIAVFGGDPEAITLFGQSAGAASVGHHLLSPLSRGLFHRAIMESGSPSATWGFASKQEAKQLSEVQARDLGCTSYNRTEVMRCLRDVNPRDLIATEPVRGVDYVYAHKPVVDGEFITENPSDLLKKRNFNQIPLLLGVNKDEASFFMMTYDPVTFPIHREMNGDELSWQKVMDCMAYNGWEPLTQQIVQMLYGGDEGFLSSLKKSWGDFFIVCSTTEVDVAFTASGNPVYRYLFAHRADNSPWPKWTGVMHTDEMHYVFGVPLQSNKSQDEVQFSKRIMQFWGNFARTGNPNGKQSSDPVVWPRYTLESKEFLILQGNSSTVDGEYREKFCSFWRDLRPQLISAKVSSSIRLNDLHNKIK